MKFPKEGEYASFYRGYIEKAGQGDFFELLDINGRIVLQGDIKDRVQTDFIASGLYWLRLYTPEKVLTVKLTKTK